VGGGQVHSRPPFDQLHGSGRPGVDLDEDRAECRSASHLLNNEIDADEAHQAAMAGQGFQQPLQGADQWIIWTGQREFDTTAAAEPRTVAPGQADKLPADAKQFCPAGEHQEAG